MKSIVIADADRIAALLPSFSVFSPYQFVLGERDESGALQTHGTGLTWFASDLKKKRKDEHVVFLLPFFVLLDVSHPAAFFRNFPNMSVAINSSIK